MKGSRRPRPVCMRLRLEPGRSYYVRVNVWPSRRTLERRLRQHGVRAVDRTYAACHELEVRRFSPGRAVRRDPIVCEVNFHRRNMGVGIVSHEMLHASLAYARRLRLDLTPIAAESANGRVADVEEAIAYVHGDLVSQFVRRAYALGLYP